MMLPTIESAQPLTDAELPPVPGCYVIFSRPECAGDIGRHLVSQTGVLYVGKAEDSIRKRVQGTHLLDGRTGSSTLRRSLAALLRENLSLVPVPRSTNLKDSKRFTNYRLDIQSDARLSEWIAANLLVTAISSDSPKSTEDHLIANLRPPLCLTGWANPNSDDVKILRKQCASLAENGIRRG